MTGGPGYALFSWLANRPIGIEVGSQRGLHVGEKEKGSLTGI